MATQFCIPAYLAEQLNAAAKRGEIDLEKMELMSSAERRAMFEKYVTKEIAQKINAKYEEAINDSDNEALLKWAKEVFTGSEQKKKRQKDILRKINELKEQGVLTPESEREFLSDLVAEKLGATLTPDEAKEIVRISEKLESLADKESDFGTPTLEYFEARKEMDNYLDSITPSSNLKILSSTIGRGNLLTRPASVFLNIQSNTLQGTMQALARRMETRRVGGANNRYALDYMKFANKVYEKTGYDITRMQSIGSDRKILGEQRVTSQGEGAIRKLGRIYEDVVFGKLLGAPDTFFSSVAGADRSNLESTKMALDMGLKGEAAQKKALELFKDSTRIEPLTKEGQQIRDKAMADSMYSTFTNESLANDIASGIRKVFNVASGDLRIGDQIQPFVKTPAAALQAGLMSSGIFLPPEITIRTIKTLKDIRNGEDIGESFWKNFDGLGKHLIRAGLGLTFAYLLSLLFKPEDFIGEFPVSEKERQLLALKQATTNSVKIGNRWVSLDYFGIMGAPLVGILYAKKYGKSLPDKVYNYTKGVLRQSTRLPGFDQAYSTLKSIQESTPTAGKTAADEMKDVANMLIGFVHSRSQPGILSDLAKMTDSSERATDRGDVLSKVKNSLPGLRQTLPEKKNIFNETVKTEPWYSIVFFGSRVKTAKDSELIKELSILDETGNLPSLSDVSRTSPRAKELKDQIGQEKFSEAMEFYGTKLHDQMTRAIQSNGYKNLPEENKRDLLNKIKTDMFDLTLMKYKYRKPQETRTKRQ